jgi:hypothetical protein
MKLELKSKIPKLDMRVITRDVYESVEDYKEAVALRAKEIMEEEFINQGTEEGPWLELNEITIRKKGHDIILFESGEFSLSPYAIQVGENWRVGIKSSKFDPAYHEYGTEFMPARPIVGPAKRQVNREIRLKSKPEQVQIVTESFWSKVARWFK